MSENVLTFEQALAVLRRRWLLVVVGIVVVGGAAFLASHLATKKYTASAALLFQSSQLTQEVAGLQTSTSSQDQQSAQDTNVQTVMLGGTAAQVARQIPGLTRNDVLSALSVSAVGDTNVVTVSATTKSPALSARVANRYTSDFVAAQARSQRAYYQSALAAITKQIAGLSAAQRTNADGLALQDRAQSLGELVDLAAGPAQVLQTATVPTSPSSPKTARNTEIGVILGLVLAMIGVFLFEHFDRRFRDARDLERAYDQVLLGSVPYDSMLAAETPSLLLPPSLAETFGLMFAHLRYFSVDSRLQVIMVGSALPGDGKTTAALHLAIAAARAGAKTLLVECDLRRPTLARRTGVTERFGLADVLIGSVTRAEAVHPMAIGRDAQSSESQRVDVLAAGAVLPPNPTDMLNSHSMHSLMKEARETYDVIIIDTPPLAVVPDAFSLIADVDGVILVGRIRAGDRNVARRVGETLQNVGAHVLGVVANGVKAGAAYDYGYGYRYAAEETASAPHPQDEADLAVTPPTPVDARRH